MASSYRDLEIYNISFTLFIKTHKFSLELPKYELYELGSQLRRSADSVNSNIVEGYDRKRYKNDFIRFLSYAHSSNDETINHLEKIKELYPDQDINYNELIEDYNNLGKKINKFIDYVFKKWNSN